MNEEQIYKDWNYIKKTIEKCDKYFSKKDIDDIEKKLLIVLRKKKLKRVFNI